MPLDGLHGERDRAESFGSVAEQYDRLHPGYPSALIDDLVSRSPTPCLGCRAGTGKVAVSLMGRGVPVLGSSRRPHGRGGQAAPCAGRGRFLRVCGARRSYVRSGPTAVLRGTGWIPSGSRRQPWPRGARRHGCAVLELPRPGRCSARGLRRGLPRLRAELAVLGGPERDRRPRRGPLRGQHSLEIPGSGLRWPRILDSDTWTSMFRPSAITPGSETPDSGVSRRRCGGRSTRVAVWRGASPAPSLDGADFEKAARHVALQCSSEGRRATA